MKSVLDGWAVTFDTARRGLGGAAASSDPSSHSPSINGRIVVSVALRF